MIIIPLLFGVMVGTDQAPAPVERAMTVRVHKESSKWEPFSLRVAGDPSGPCSGKCQVRKYPLKDDTLVVVSVFPPGKRFKRKHYEVRFLVQESWLEDVKVATVISSVDGQDDSITLRKKGVEFQEEAPGSAVVQVAGFELIPGGLVVGSVRKSSQGDFSWSASLPGKKKVKAVVVEAPKLARFDGQGWSVSLPEGWKGEATSPDNIVFKGPEGEVALKVRPADKPDLEAEKKNIPGEAKEFPLHLPAFQVTGSSGTQVVVAGAGTLYFFSAAKDESWFQSIIASLRDAVK